jgi:hypothetical protein
VGAISPGVVEDVMTALNFTGSHKVGWGVFKDDLGSEPVVGICF